MANISTVNTSLISQTGTGAYVGATSPTFVTPVLGAASATSIAFSSTSGIIGTTTAPAAAVGSVGQIISSTVLFASAVAITTATDTNITSISLTAGDWDVMGTVGTTGNAATIVMSIYGWISSTSATMPDPSIVAGPSLGTAGVTIYAQSYYNIAVPTMYYQLSGTTTIYLSVNSTFTTNTSAAYGFIYARRRR